MPRFGQRVILFIRRFVPAAVAKQGAMYRVSRTAFSAGLTSTVVAVVLAVALVTSLAQPAFAQTKTDPLGYFKNYFLTGGDYVVGGWQKNSQTVTFQTVTLPINNTATQVPYLTGTLAIPDQRQPLFGVQSQGVPAGADIVAAFLYWQTVESTSQSSGWGQIGFLKSANASNPVQYQFTGTPLQSASPVGWSSGGCTGGGGTKVIRTYRTDVLRYLDIDSTGKIIGNSTYTIMLADAGSNGSGTPFTLGATLVLVYRDVTSSTLKSVVIYDGSYSANNQALVTTQTIQGFYQPVVPPAVAVAKLTHIVGDGQSNKSESVTFGTSTGSSVTLPSLYSGLPPFPGVYNGAWDNPTWFPNAYGNAVVGSASTVTTASTTVTPDPIIPDCVSWGAVVFSTNVQDTDGDGLLDIWESQSGLTDPNGNPLPDLYAMGADPNVRDIFAEIDYMCSALDANGNCVSGSGQHSHNPPQGVLDLVGDAFSKAPKVCFNKVCKGINIHFDIGSEYVGKCSTTNTSACPDPYIIQGTSVPLQGGQQILETACTPPTPPSTSSCIFFNNSAGTLVPGYAGTVGWKLDYLRFKNGDPSASSPLPAYFDHHRKDMFHYALFAHTVGLPRWITYDGTLISVAVQSSVATVTTAQPHGLNIGDVVTISGAPLGSNINGVYTVASVIYPNGDPTQPSTQFTISIPAGNNAPDAFNPPYQTAGIGVGTGVPRSNGGVADLFGGDVMITLGRWDNATGSPFVQASVLTHELGHNMGLGHAGDLSDPNNCKPNYQSVMNYLYEIAGLTGSDGQAQIDFSRMVVPDLAETNLIESNGMGSLLPYLPRWYASALSPIAQKLGISPILFRHCDGTPILDNAQMVRAEGDPTVLTTATNPSDAIDWNWNGTTNTAADSGYSQDLNFSGGAYSGNPTANPPTPPFQGFNDWPKIKLNQVGGRSMPPYALLFSLDVWLTGDTASQTDLGDQAITSSSLWPQVVNGWSDPGILGSFSGGANGTFTGGANGTFSGGANGTFSGGANGTFTGGANGTFSGGANGTFSEQDVETAAANGNTPSGLKPTPSKFTIDLDWSAPHLGFVNFYNVWRGNCPTTKGTTCTISNSSPSILPSGTGVQPAGNGCDVSTQFPNGHMFCDTTAKNGVLYLYFVEANITYNPGTKNQLIQQSGPSNTVTASR
jgi:hypothetical protein